MIKKLVIPPRPPRTPEQMALMKELDVINDLYMRWVSNELVPADAFLLMQYMDRLIVIKERDDLHMRQMNWRVTAMTLNSTKDNKET